MSIAERTHSVEFSDAEVCDEVNLQERYTGCKGRTQRHGSHEKEISLFNMSFIGH